MTLKPTKFHGCIIIMKIFKAFWLLLAAILDFRRHIEFISCLDVFGYSIIWTLNPPNFMVVSLLQIFFKAFRLLLAAILDCSLHIEFFSMSSCFLGYII